MHGVERIKTNNAFLMQKAELQEAFLPLATVIGITMSKDTKLIAHSLFSALRELDEQSVDVIHVEGIDDACGGVDIAAAVMNRLRKAATIIE